MNFAINPLIAIGVLASTAATDAAYVFFNASVSSRRRVWAANWSAIWYAFRLRGDQLHRERALCRVRGPGIVARAFASVTWLHRSQFLTPARHDPP